MGRVVTYVDATHLTRWERRPYVRLARKYGCQVEAIFFNVPVETCVRRNRRRGRVVPEEVIRAMAELMEPPTVGEGLARILIPGLLAR